MLESESGSVVSDSLQLQGPKPAKLLCPWNSPGKTTGVGCQSLLQGILHQCNCYSLCICPRPFTCIFGLCFFSFTEFVKRLSHFYLPFHVLSVSFLCRDWGFPTSPGQFVLWTRKSELGKMTLAVNEKNLQKYQKDNRCRIYWMLRISYIKNQWQEPTVQLREPYSVLCGDPTGKEITLLYSRN